MLTVANRCLLLDSETTFVSKNFGMLIRIERAITGSV